ncbi:MAG TPA: DUF438 domain-containing protein [Anaeromyxobacteraceae bacterium]|nr:DUF438 domain-containing protein [Anaeromyxobacteraceae bacterium]
MSELIDNATHRKQTLKDLMRQLDAGEPPAEVRARLKDLLGAVPYHEVVEVEQQLFAEGVDPKQMSRACDLHAQAVNGLVDLRRSKAPPPGHPAHTFKMENEALRAEVGILEKLFAEIEALSEDADALPLLGSIRARFNALMDVDKHYLRKEHLLFPFLEKHGVTGPSKVMWAKHDETRELLEVAMSALPASGVAVSGADARALIEFALRPAARAVADMVVREESILLPMSLEKLSAAEWLQVERQSPEIGFCLYDPQDVWRPSGVPEPEQTSAAAPDRIRLPTGSFTVAELEAMMNALPFDVTFVDRDDTVRFFSHGPDRVFARSRAVIGRKVQYCHPPSSVSTVDEILDGFRAGSHDSAAFWIDLRGKFVHIEYRALRSASGEYLGCLEVTQDLTEKRALAGEQRLLSWQRGA